MDDKKYIDADLDVSGHVTVWECNCSEFGKQTVMAVDDLWYLPAADVVEVVKCFEAVDKFRDALMGEFLRLCCYNDYNKLTLLKIGDTIYRVYGKCIESMKGGAE